MEKGAAAAVAVLPVRFATQAIHRYSLCHGAIHRCYLTHFLPSPPIELPLLPPTLTAYYQVWPP